MKLIQKLAHRKFNQDYDELSWEQKEIIEEEINTGCDEEVWGNGRR